MHNYGVCDKLYIDHTRRYLEKSLCGHKLHTKNFETEKPALIKYGIDTEHSLTIFFC